MNQEYHRLLSDSSFIAELHAWEEEQGEELRAKGCQHDCAGKLDRAYYPRQARGFGAELSSSQKRRVSFCCREEGCRKRHTPKSLLYLRHKAYSFVGVMLTLCLRSGRKPEVTLRKARCLCNASEATVRRWKGWMLKFLGSPAWKLLRTRLDARFSEERFPLSLLESTCSADSELPRAITNMLCFVSLLSIERIT